VFKKLLSFLRGDNDPRSGGLAKSRLHFVLVQDRAGLGADDIAQFKKELVSVIEKYFVINETGFDITYKRDNDLTTLQINSPILVKKRESVPVVESEPEETVQASA
jgi:cell division topological specificity factor